MCMARAYVANFPKQCPRSLHAVRGIADLARMGSRDAAAIRSRDKNVVLKG
jgi:hypothetical protein